MKRKTALLGAAAMLIAGPALAERGADGHLNIIYYQAPSILNPYLSGGTKDLESSSLIIEPLARFDQDGNMVPYLAEAIPTLENGGISADLTTVTWKLKPGLLWSDGTAVTAEDAVFTWQYCTDPEGGCAQAAKFEGVKTVEAVDPLTIKITFDGPKPYPYQVFVGGQAPILQKAQFKDCLGTKAPTCTAANFGPIGTGPFKVTEFRPNDVISLVANPHFRDPAKPAFATITFKGGGDAAGAARSVLETGEFDYAWNLQIAPEVLEQMLKAGKGEIVSAFGTLVERIQVNLTDPSPSLPADVRSTRKAPHPILSDIKVRQALSMAIDRALLSEIGYGTAGRPTCNLVPAPAIFASTANDACLVQDIEGAKKLLDEAGWKVGAGGIREKDGKQLKLLFQTSVNAVRQDFQALIKEWWKEIGVETELKNVSGSVFFGGDPGSPDTFQKFYADVEMYANNFDGTDPEAYLAQGLCDKEPRPDTGWQGENINRYCDPEYDALIAKLSEADKIEDRAELAKAANDKMMQSFSLLPLVDRGRVSGKSKTLGGVIMNTWDTELWNAADWYRIK